MTISEATRGSPERASVLRMVVVVGVTLFATAAAVVLVVPGAERAPWEVPASREAIVLYVLTMILLAATAIVVCVAPPSSGRLSASTPLVILTLAWAFLVVSGRFEAPPLARLTASIIGALAPAALLHLSASVARWPPRHGVAVVATGYAACAVPAATRAVVTAPFRDPFCRAGCEAPGVVLLDSTELTRWFGALLLGASALVAGCALISALLGIGRRTGPRPVLVAVVPAALIEVALPVIPTARPGLGTIAEYGEALFLSRCLTTLLLAAVLIVDATMRVRRLARVRVGLSRQLHGADGGSLQRILSHALKDPSVRVEYWLPSLDAWADSSGRPLPSVSSPDETFAITRAGLPVARVKVGRAPISLPDLESVVGAAARLVIDNERLRVELIAQARALRTSRLRVVEAADSARRTLERDLHDGAQQRLLAASYALRLAAVDASDPHAAAEAERRLAVVLGVLSSLRAAARGLYPPILADAGLVPALEALARSDASRPLSIDATPSPFPRLDPGVELTAYLAVREAALQATREAVTAGVEYSAGRLLIAIEHIASYRVHRIADRVHALGGALVVDRDRLLVEVPCA